MRSATDVSLDSALTHDCHSSHLQASCFFPCYSTLLFCCSSSTVRWSTRVWPFLVSIRLGANVFRSRPLRSVHFCWASIQSASTATPVPTNAFSPLEKPTMSSSIVVRNKISVIYSQTYGTKATLVSLVKRAKTALPRRQERSFFLSKASRILPFFSGRSILAVYSLDGFYRDAYCVCTEINVFPYLCVL